LNPQQYQEIPKESSGGKGQCDFIHWRFLLVYHHLFLMGTI